MLEGRAFQPLTNGESSKLFGKISTSKKARALRYSSKAVLVINPSSYFQCCLFPNHGQSKLSSPCWHFLPMNAVCEVAKR